MPRPRRIIPPSSVVHLVNRGNDRRKLFAEAADYKEFLALVSWTKSRSPLRLLAYVVMPNHWHLVAWPDEAAQISRFMHRLNGAHSARVRRTTRTVGQGHIYQDRYHSFIVETEQHYYRVLRYVEANPVRSGLVANAQDWSWSSLGERLGVDRGLLDAGPAPLPTEWSALVNQALPPEDVEDIRARLRRSHFRAWDVQRVGNRRK